MPVRDNVYSLPARDNFFLKKSHHRTLQRYGIKCLTLYLIDTPFNVFANRADPDQTALVRADTFANKANPDQTALIRGV